jgi:hypothetical protein
MPEKSLSEINWASLTGPSRSFFPSPAAWEDEVLYFLLVDRFSNGREKNFKGNDGTVVANLTFGYLSEETVLCLGHVGLCFSCFSSVSSH